MFERGAEIENCNQETALLMFLRFYVEWRELSGSRAPAHMDTFFFPWQSPLPRYYFFVSIISNSLFGTGITASETRNTAFHLGSLGS